MKVTEIAARIGAYILCKTGIEVRTLNPKTAGDTASIPLSRSNPTFKPSSNEFKMLTCYLIMWVLLTLLSISHVCTSYMDQPGLSQMRK